MDFWERKKHKKITSLADFIDLRARALAAQHNLLLNEIFPMYRDLEAEVLANNGQIEIDPNIPQDETIKKLVCGAVISYELASRESLRFEDDSKIAVIKRSAQPRVYDSLGRYYEGIAIRLKDKKY